MWAFAGLETTYCREHVKSTLRLPSVTSAKPSVTLVSAWLTLLSLSLTVMCLTQVITRECERAEQSYGCAIVIREKGPVGYKSFWLDVVLLKHKQARL
jgi:hypothetical protein